jgi:cyanophycin synthetase
VPRDVIGNSIKKFTSYANNPGRVNLYKLNGGHVIVDYGHNANAFEAICRMASKWEDRRVTGVIGLPGDRDNSLIVHAGRVAARGFHRIIIREDHDLRGRKPGEVAKLLCDAAQGEAPATECQIMLDENEALQHAVKTMQHGEVVVVFYEKLESLRRVLETYSAQPVQSLSELNAESKPRRIARFAKTDGRRPPLQLVQAHRSSAQPQL